MEHFIKLCIFFLLITAKQQTTEKEKLLISGKMSAADWLRVGADLMKREVICNQLPAAASFREFWHKAKDRDKENNTLFPYVITSKLQYGALGPDF